MGDNPYDYPSTSSAETNEFTPFCRCDVCYFDQIFQKLKYDGVIPDDDKIGLEGNSILDYISDIKASHDGTESYDKYIDQNDEKKKGIYSTVSEYKTKDKLLDY